MEPRGQAHSKSEPVAQYYFARNDAGRGSSRPIGRRHEIDVAGATSGRHKRLGGTTFDARCIR
jgi:hypothetical protein